MKYDGHVHSPYCPHGSNDRFEEYIEQAIEKQFKEITFTEHAPLPEGFEDPSPEKDSVMKKDMLEEYIVTLQHLKKQYASKIKINIGLEIDYIKEYETETKKFLSQYGKHLDDGILSVHFLKNNNQYFCMDYSPEEFGIMVKEFGSVEEIYSCYYSALKSSIIADLGPFKPMRIGHMTLVHKFQICFPCSKDFGNEICEILMLLKERKLQIDYNGAGVKKPFCLEPYPPELIIKKAISLGIPLVYGSDAHAANGIDQGYDQLYKEAILVSPTLK